jgi:hypothetical protein
MGEAPVPLREGLQITDDRAVILIERVTLRLAEFQEEHDEAPVDLAFVIRGEKGTTKAGWSIQSADIRPMLALAGLMLAQEAVE